MIAWTEHRIGLPGIALVMVMAALGSPVVARYDYRDTQLAGSIVLHADHSFAYEVAELAEPDLPQDRFRQLTRGGGR